jgi:hypothetical protein
VRFILLGGETGVIIAKGTANVHFVMKLTWKSCHAPASGA